MKELKKLKQLIDLNLKNKEKACALEILENKEFGKCSASVNEKHHCYTGGLAKHTREVTELTIAMALTADSFKVGKKNKKRKKIKINELVLACLFHDTGKTKDYTKKKEKWVGTKHKREIHHISESCFIWNRLAEKHGIDKKVIYNVNHAILAHHGLREWGSPVAPNTGIAWLLHLADSASARLEEEGRVDFVKSHS